MEKKKSSRKKQFKTSEEMDDFLENQDLGELFSKFGKTKKVRALKDKLHLKINLNKSRERS